MDLHTYIGKFSKFRWPLFAILVLIPVLGGCGGGVLNAGNLLEQLLLGLILGSVYALIALGYTLVYGVIKLINFAHGDIYMLGAFLGYYLLRLTFRYLHFEWGWSLIYCFIISLVISSLICAILAVIMERLAYRPLRNSTRIAALITAVGVSFLLENAGIIVFGPNPKSYEPKTFKVYQLQLAESSSFDHPDQYEIQDNEQTSLPAFRFDDTKYARVRLVNVHGKSDWGPVLELEPGKTGGFTELTQDQIPVPTGKQPALIRSIGYQLKTENNRDRIVVSWAPARSGDVKIQPVFSTAIANPKSANGRTHKPLIYELPIRTANGDKVRLPVFYVVIIVTTLVLLALLNLLINRSMFGISMRALSFDRDAAKLMGVNTDLVIAQTFAIGGACAGVAGNLVGVYNQSIEPLMGILPGLKAFVAAVVGGIGSIPGAAIGGLIMGLSEAFVKGNISEDYSKMADAVAFAILILVLLFRPTGIFGRASKEKV